MKLTVNYTAPHLEFGFPGQPPLFRLEAKTHQNLFRTLKKIELLIDGELKTFWVKPEEIPKKAKEILTNPDKIYLTTHTGSLEQDIANTELNKLINIIFRETARGSPTYETPKDPGPLLTSLYHCSYLTTLCCRHIFAGFTSIPENDSSESIEAAYAHALEFLTSNEATVRDCIASLASFRDHLPELLLLQDRDAYQELDRIYNNLDEILFTKYRKADDETFPEFVYNHPLLLELYAAGEEILNYWFDRINTYETAQAGELPGKAAAKARGLRASAERVPAAGAGAPSTIPTSSPADRFLENGITLRKLKETREKSTDHIKSVLASALGLGSFSKEAVHRKWRQLHPDLKRTPEDKEDAETLFKEVQTLIDILKNADDYR